MAEWKAVGAASLLADGAMIEVRVDGVKLLLARVDGVYYAVQAFCSHMGGAFVSGKLEGYIISCPRNRSRFDVRDGSVAEWTPALPGVMRAVVAAVQPPKPLRVYPARAAEGQVWVQM